MEMNIIFNFDNNSTIICDEHFGTMNNTQNTLNDIDFIIYSLLLFILHIQMI